MNEDQTLYMVNSIYPYTLVFSNESQKTTRSAKPKSASIVNKKSHPDPHPKTTITDFFGGPTSKSQQKQDGNLEPSSKRPKREEYAMKAAEDSDDSDNEEISSKLKEFQKMAAIETRSNNKISHETPHTLRGGTCSKDIWEEHGKLLLFNKKDVQASSKVQKHS